MTQKGLTHYRCGHTFDLGTEERHLNLDCSARCLNESAEGQQIEQDAIKRIRQHGYTALDRMDPRGSTGERWEDEEG